MVLTGSAFLVKDLTPERHRMTRIAGIIGGLAFGAVCLLAGILLTIEAVQASGSGRVLLAIGAVFLYLFAALMAFAAMRSA